MKQTLKFLSILAIVAVFGLVNCKKEDSTPAVDTTPKKQLITKSAWVLKSSVSTTPVDLDGQNGASTDLFSQMKLCDRDDSYLFNADSTTTEKNNTKCSSSEPATYKGDWLLSPNDKTLTWDGDDYTVIEISATQLILNYKFTVGTDKYDLTDTYSH